ncbi:uncharacterized protein LY89DRAFT_686541 [Mollisia scopiformis]|uniref:Uncharacterized protein n=1 Tax=Mollisia scopiformis TaxID=149040 RepID=A0A194X564_MOLSC|nr:uncharacterized protein LY89DRAFT_686541 [Mollisia scopiformis]KUJ14942.1 hypothetical protein LY89DRAFT_686541 [Mollisia scopiformis]
MPTLEAKSGDWPYRGTNDEMPYYELSFCQSRGFTQQLHNMGRNSSTAAGRCLADFLGFLGERIVLELNAYLFYYWRHEITRLASFELLKDLKPYHNYINHISLEYCVGLDRIGNLVKLCEYTQSSLKSLKSIIFWFQITKRQLNAVLQSPNEQEWFRACKLLAVEKIEVKLRIVGRVPRHWTGDPREDGLPPSHILARSNVWNQRYPREGGYEDKEMAAMLKKILTPGRDWGLTDDLQEDFGMGRLFGDDGTSMNEA